MALPFSEKLVTGTQDLSAAALEFGPLSGTISWPAALVNASPLDAKTANALFTITATVPNNRAPQEIDVLGAHIEVPGALGGGTTVAIGEVMAVSANGTQMVAAYRIENPPRNVAITVKIAPTAALKGAWAGPASATIEITPTGNSLVMLGTTGHVSGIDFVVGYSNVR